MKKKVYVGLSGGVDSAVTAFLLKEKNYDVTGVYMKNWSGDDYGIQDDCPWQDDLRDARRVAEFLNIPLKVYNFEKEYRKYVIEDFFNEYRAGRTPNPDVLCNKFIKFDKFLEKSLEDGADYIATGHYAKTEGGRLFNAKDRKKDQTYFLHQIKSSQLEKSIFPLSELTKFEVRKIAKDAKLPNADKKDSQGICFVGKINLAEFLSNEIRVREGDIVDIDSGEIVGKHKGVQIYTNGQRDGLGIGGSEEPYFVVDKDVEKNILYVAMGKTNPSLWKGSVELESVHTISGKDLEDGEYDGMVRYRGEKIRCILEGNVIKFSEAVWAPADGQSVVLYQNSECLGGGKIKNVLG